MSSIEHFAIYADDPTALKDFYVQSLGLRVIVERLVLCAGCLLGQRQLPMRMKGAQKYGCA